MRQYWVLVAKHATAYLTWLALNDGTIKSLCTRHLPLSYNSLISLCFLAHSRRFSYFDYFTFKLILNILSILIYTYYKFIDRTNDEQWIFIDCLCWMDVIILKYRIYNRLPNDCLSRVYFQPSANCRKYFMSWVEIIIEVGQFSSNVSFEYSYYVVFKFNVLLQNAMYFSWNNELFACIIFTKKIFKWYFNIDFAATFKISIYKCMVLVF